MERIVEFVERDVEEQPCVLCLRMKGETLCMIRRSEGQGAEGSARNARSFICSGCILRFAYLGRIWRDLRLTVVNPTPEILVEIIKNGTLVSVATETASGTVLDQVERDRLALHLAKDDEESLQGLYFRYLAEVVSRLPRRDYIVELLKRRGLVPPGWNLELAPSGVSFAMVDDDGLAEMGRMIQEKMRGNLERGGSFFGCRRGSVVA